MKYSNPSLLFVKAGRQLFLAPLLCSQKILVPILPTGNNFWYPDGTLMKALKKFCPPPEENSVPQQRRRE